MTRLPRTRTALVLFLLLVSLSCQSASGVDQAVVTAERTLRAADGIYLAAMQWYYTPGNAALLNPGQKAVFENVRIHYHDAYMAAQSAIDARKAGTAGDVTKEMAALEELLGQVNRIIASFVAPGGGPS